MEHTPFEDHEIELFERLTEAIDDYFEEESELSEPCPPITDNSPIHKAVCQVQAACYDRHLPYPAVDCWIKFKRASNKPDSDQRRDDIREHGWALWAWAKQIVDKHTPENLANTNDGIPKTRSRFTPPACPKCDSKTKVTSTKTNTRNLKCTSCDYTWTATRST